MHFHLKITFLLAFIAFSVLSCRSDSRDNSRAYVEGKITGNLPDFSTIIIKIESGDKIVGETNADASGRFTVSGPLISDSFSIILNNKIKSFSSSQEGCRLSSDSLEIFSPVGVTYLTFNEIILE